MIPTRFHIARITLQMLAPLVIGTGHGDDIADAVCVTDANGLPTLPGSSLAGVLRHAFAASRVEDPREGPEVCALFGTTSQSRRQRSRITVSWAQLHDQHDRPVSPRPGALPDDPVLMLAKAGVLRDHVRIDAGGVADDKGKFDELLVPAGVRFTFELRLDDLDDGADTLRELIGLLRSPSVRLGGKGRRGLGAFDVVSVRARAFDLRDATDWEAWSSHPTALHIPSAALSPFPLPSPVALRDWKTFEFDLQAEDLLLVGGGAQLPGEPDGDLFPVRDPRVSYATQPATVFEGRKAPWLLPATAIKGALRHRTRFWLAAQRQAWAGEDGDEAWAQVEEAMSHLFGEMSHNEGGRPGRVVLDDITFDAELFRLQHVRLDRFTLGPMDGMLFDECPLWLDAPLTVRLLVDEGQLRRDFKHGDADALMTAFERAVADLREGRLSLGGGSNRGHGYFREVAHG